jgi:GNAT superfamily N-acetyltransferase
MPEPIIRPYQPQDRPALLKLAADTAFFGKPLEAYMEDRRLFWDAMYIYYIDYEPEHTWVACVGDELTGFLTGCTVTHRRSEIWSRRILPTIASRAARGAYKIGRLTLRYTWEMAAAALRHEIPQEDQEKYPAHLHINVNEHYRGQGLGRGLMAAYLAQLRSLGVKGVHLHTTSLNKAAIRLYLTSGFSLLDARLTRSWRHYFSEPVQYQCYGLRLDQSNPC